MTQKDKQLLLKDLCARVLYGVIVHFHDINVDDYDRQLIGEDIDFIKLDRRNCKPYLRPMSSMTEEEAIKYVTLTHYNIDDNGKPYRELTVEAIDWLNTNHFDYRGLIEKGLALEAPKDMYK